MKQCPAFAVHPAADKDSYGFFFRKFLYGLFIGECANGGIVVVFQHRCNLCEHIRVPADDEYFFSMSHKLVILSPATEQMEDADG